MNKASALLGLAIVISLFLWALSLEDKNRELEKANDQLTSEVEYYKSLSN